MVPVILNCQECSFSFPERINYGAKTNPLFIVIHLLSSKGTPRGYCGILRKTPFSKSLKSSAPLFKHPDPFKPFVVEVEASNMGVGAVLVVLLLDCIQLPFTLTNSSLAQHNYAIMEILAMKSALEE